MCGRVGNIFWAKCSGVVYSVVLWVERGVQRPCAGGFEAAKELRRRVFIPQPGQVEFHKKGWPGLRLREGGGDSKGKSKLPPDWQS